MDDRRWGFAALSDEEFERFARDGPVLPPAEAPAAADPGPWYGSLERLLVEASRDRDRFATAAAGLAQRVVTRTSSGRHVTGTARHGVVTDVAVDVVWARGAEARDVEVELVEVLAGLRRDAVPEGMRDGPCHPASVVLRQLAADPALLVRLAGMRR